MLLLICSFFRLKELFQVKNGLTTLLLFFWKMAKIWVGQTTLKGEKKEDGLKDKKILFSRNLLKKNLSIEGCY